MPTLADYIEQAKGIEKHFKGLTSLRGESFLYHDVLPAAAPAVAVLWVHTRYSSMELGWTSTGRHCYLDASGNRIKTDYDEVEFSERVDAWLRG
jgi:hypothetical protein